MSSSHFPGTRRGGFIPQWRPKAASTSRGAFTPPGDALRHGRSRKPFIICSCEKCARNSSAICTYKSLDLKFPRISSYKKIGGGWGACGYAPANRPNRSLLSRAAPAGEGSLRIGLSRPVHPWLFFSAAWRPIEVTDREEQNECRKVGHERSSDCQFGADGGGQSL